MADKKKKKHISKDNQVEEVKRLKDQLARALADYDNLQKRVDREREIFIKSANLGFISSLLPVFDMLEQAQSHLQDSGLAIAISQLRETLKEEGIEKITVSPGDEFDENLFEAIEAVKSKNEDDKGKVVEVVLSGWKYIDGSIIRPAKVKVYEK